MDSFNRRQEGCTWPSIPCFGGLGLFLGSLLGGDRARPQASHVLGKYSNHLVIGLNSRNLLFFLPAALPVSSVTTLWGGGSGAPSLGADLDLEGEPEGHLEIFARHSLRGQ